MFIPKTEVLKRFAGLYPDKITELEGLFDGPTHVYIDFANVRKRLNWRIDFAKLKDLFDSLPHIKSVSFYFGTMAGDRGSEGFIHRVKKIGFRVVTKEQAEAAEAQAAISLPLVQKDSLGHNVYGSSYCAWSQ